MAFRSRAFRAAGATEERFSATITRKKTARIHTGACRQEILPAAYAKPANSSANPGRNREGEPGSNTATEKTMSGIQAHRLAISRRRPASVLTNIQPREPIAAANSGGFQATAVPIALQVTGAYGSCR